MQAAYAVFAQDVRAEARECHAIIVCENGQTVPAAVNTGANVVLQAVIPDFWK